MEAQVRLAVPAWDQRLLDAIAELPLDAARDLAGGRAVDRSPRLEAQFDAEAVRRQARVAQHEPRAGLHAEDELPGRGLLDPHVVESPEAPEPADVLFNRALVVGPAHLCRELHVEAGPGDRYGVDQQGGGKAARRRTMHVYFRAVTVISMCAVGAASLVTPTVVRAGRGP